MTREMLTMLRQDFDATFTEYRSAVAALDTVRAEARTRLSIAKLLRRELARLGLQAEDVMDMTQDRARAARQRRNR